MAAINILDQEIRLSDRDLFMDDVLLGLMRQPKELPGRYALDDRGAQLFEALCDTPEYYARRMELSILRGSLGEIAEAIGERSLLIQLGGGTMEQARMLLDALPALSGFVPVGSAGSRWDRQVETMRRDYRRQRISPLCADPSRQFTLPRMADLEARRVVYIPGGIVGAEGPQRTIQRLREMGRLCGRGGGLIVAVDLKKSPRILTEAHNDRAGLTAGLNLNLLERINRELGANFQVDQFVHFACYNPRAGRVEMHLVNFQDQVVHLGGVAVPIDMGEAIMTHKSYVYAPEEFASLAHKAGLRVRGCWMDSQRIFSVQYLTLD